ncbi:LysM peptidoglycan-binding domain-containing protein [Dokdonella immobilis]|uniref:Membrane-bound lytic murein transglycosylase D n=1 Tax=Dokdonella immobilis TaxID=578942 RepID=A0A1I4V413_9GAMM|nr:LysM peptidoglycan-binding domain-containing protein [Dokdonella immobilis]SFM95863.1 membrane-bound lytic murein transglycosylase D [Dokdonella immobilis]
MIDSRPRSWAWPVALTLSLALAACSVPVSQTRPPVDRAAEPHGQPYSAATEPAPLSPDAGVPRVPASPWQRLREGFVMPGCDYEPAILREASRFTRSADRFASNWRDAMPFLLLVLDDIERRKLPTEFALLPYVESRYRPLVPATSRSPAGVWQLMPGTATSRGLVVDRTLDERLDIVASTRVALDLLERYDREFGDWRLATMAYNAGEYRIKAQLAATPGRLLSADALARLKLSPITHQHLARLLALACIIREPDRFRVSLPTVEADDVLDELALSAPIDLRLAAALSGLSPERLRRLNAARDPASPSAVLRDRILLPKTRLAGFETGLQEIPVTQRAYWKSLRVEHPIALMDLASRMHVPTTALVAANRLSDAADLRPGQVVLVPAERSETAAGGVPEFHLIRSGDTLSTIALRYGLRLGQLLRWNAIGRDSTLRIGTRLRIRAPGY